MDKKQIEQIDLTNPSYFNNRELSWLGFNKRVLEEAMDPRNPLLERLKFLAIFSSNLDEFFMVRVAGLKDQVDAGFLFPEDKAGLTPKKQLASISKLNHPLVKLHYNTYHSLMLQLQKDNIHLLKINQLNDQQIGVLEQLFDNLISPVLTPLAVDAYHPFPILLNKSINIAVTLRELDHNEKTDNQKRALVQVPRGLERYIALTDENSYEVKFVLLEEVIRHFLYKLFIGYEVCSVTTFRITRNADLALHQEGAEDLLKVIEEELKKRKWGRTVRLEVEEETVDDETIQFLLEELEIHEKDAYRVHGPLDLSFLFSFYSKIIKEREHLVYSPFIPQPSVDFKLGDNIFEILSRKDILLHHPYESFDPVIEFVKQAAKDPSVLAIKQTLYRVSKDSPIIEALKEAAENGKQVLVLVELKARFDEEHNVHWAKELEKAGCHVIYGMTDLKTHSKIILVVRRGQDHIERFVHLGTGNYNESTAKIYTDFGLFTSHPELGMDASHFFNYLSGYRAKPSFYHFSISPHDIRAHLIRLIDQEMASHEKWGNGRIIAQMNSLTDKTMIMKLYEASRAGVKIDLIVRGICCLRPGIKDISDNIRVRSIVGRFLEHSRIFYFNDNGEERIYLSSADWMTRNMMKRVEICFPVHDERHKEKIKEALLLLLNDNVKAREQDLQGNYHYVSRQADEPEINSQEQLCKRAFQAAEAIE
ncbi:RNA degradosome polyphosphate kinase [Ammoniphilus sp. CFH 90114]|uniref:RNA degradosome polyphosphate kinase n=1 Tax=Ammoniphilus sp. CFH 90114 TaxID=2493665 RepID=UPI00100EF9FF|nr:RNA degradosome polyphosphate kinase [Ammoniphilus sp. CFH 90114]RXT02353.1 RNA degradosome polyphosphate kinase [Ammoniphilus sp. CFH 90114]